MDKEMMQSRLMDYLYDELNAAERQEVERWLADNPEAQQELKALQQTRNVLAKLPDAMPTSPIITMPPKSTSRRRWLIPVITSAAAVLLLLLIATNVRVDVRDQGMIIAFGKAPAQVQVSENELSTKDLQQAIAANNALLFQQLDSIQRGLQLQLTANQQVMQENWQQRWAAQQANYEGRIKTLASQEFEQKYPQLAALVQDMQLEQQEELRLMFTQLWNNWQDVRAADLQVIETNLTAIQQNIEFNRQDTEQLFRNILVRANTDD